MHWYQESNSATVGGCDAIFVCVCLCDSVSRLFRALQELEAAGMLPSSQEEAVGLANRIRIRGANDAITIVLPEV